MVVAASVVKAALCFFHQFKCSSIEALSALLCYSCSYFCSLREAIFWGLFVDGWLLQWLKQFYLSFGSDVLR